MTGSHGTWLSRARRLLTEPTVYFFVIAVLLFVAHRLVFGNPRVVVVSAELRAKLARHLREQLGRPPTPAETRANLDAWEENEALYREALAQHLDRDDVAVRSVLANKMRARAVQDMPKREPSEAELKAFLVAHRADYETPVQYDFELVAFAKKDPAASELRASFQRRLLAGAKPSMLGRPIISGTLTRQDLTDKFGPTVAASICNSKPGTAAWLPTEDDDNLLLVHLDRIEGGLASWAVLRPRVRIDWNTAAQKQAVDRASQAILDRYRFEQEKP